MLYDIEANKQNIINNTYYLLGICIVLLIVRIPWKYFETSISRKFEKDIKIKLFQRFLKLKLKDIQNIKNGEIMSYFMKDINEIRTTMRRILSHGTRIIFYICYCNISNDTRSKSTINNCYYDSYYYRMLFSCCH